MTEVISFAIRRELREQIDTLRGDVSRSRFIANLLQKAIEKGDG
jgi:metal-responsive CopG/Arc/MetJ family transcriptional regulator